jgi:hypothetical protein
MGPEDSATSLFAPASIGSSAREDSWSVAAPWYALKRSGSTTTEVSLPTAQFVDVAPTLASAGFYPASTLPTPASPSDVSWARLTNITGLVPGVTTLHSELLLLFSPTEIGASAFAAYLQYVWDGSIFSP